ncbi:hypothetical protein BDDG_07650 [Blastomyces dermatitidis ATCC 18188]|nr:hypothetical protein BDDG_07650 [Blastomyces dermatitidis ATCC 18188]
MSSSDSSLPTECHQLQLCRRITTYPILFQRRIPTAWLSLRAPRMPWYIHPPFCQKKEPFVYPYFSQPHLLNPFIGIVLLISRQPNEMPTTYRLRDTEEPVGLAGSQLAVFHGSWIISVEGFDHRREVSMRSDLAEQSQALGILYMCMYMPTIGRLPLRCTT